VRGNSKEESYDGNTYSVLALGISGWKYFLVRGLERGARVE
jgi:hypothetical protein